MTDGVTVERAPPEDVLSFLGGVAGDTVGPTAVMYAVGLGFVRIVGDVAAFPTLRGLPTSTAVSEMERWVAANGGDRRGRAAAPE